MSGNTAEDVIIAPFLTTNKKVPRNYAVTENTWTNFINNFPDNPNKKPKIEATFFSPNFVHESQEVFFCNSKLRMEILYGGHKTPAKKVTTGQENDMKKNENDKNEGSLVMKLSGHKLKSMLFMGDFIGNNAITLLEKLREKKPDLLKADVWVLPHHGSAMMNLNDKSKEAQKYKDLATAVGAKEIVISSNIKGSYAHPRCVTVKNLFYNTRGSDKLCTKTVPEGTKDYVQCWSKVEGQERLYEPSFCKWKTGTTSVKIRQTTKEDHDGNVIWKDVVTDL